MSDPLALVLEDLGSEVFGAAWPMLRPHVSAWLTANPDRAERIRARLRDAVLEGRL